MIEVIGKEGISAKILAHSISAQTRKQLVTYELEYPRVIHSEFMTHRMLSKNCASSRAIPVKTMLDAIDQNPAMFVHWGANEAGMVANQELNDLNKEAARLSWVAASKVVLSFAKVLNSIGLHKQAANRMLEPWSRMKTVCTGTDYDNFFYLRDHPDAQPEIRELARVMKIALSESTPFELKPGEWHLPYVLGKRLVQTGEIAYSVASDSGNGALTLEEAKMISVAACAQVSYRKNDLSMEKAKKIYDMLNLNSKTAPAHWSPCEHQATPARSVLADGYVNMNNNIATWEKGITHMTRDGSFYSGNLCEFIQYRHLLS